MTDTIEILDPRAPVDDDASSDTFSLDGPLLGKAVGLRLDRSWRSYEVVLDVWTRLLREAGAIPRVLVTGERVGDEGEQTRADLEEWSKLVDCGVVGLGN
jgi:hypothetical protein